MKISGAAHALKEYAEWTDQVAVYPIEVESQYLTLGIVEELGEVGRASEDRNKEIGDVLWYTVRYCEKVLQCPIELMWDGLKDSTVLCTYHTAVNAASVLSGIEKKRIRGDGWDAVAHRRAFTSIETILMYIRYELEYGVNPVLLIDVLKMNKQKLSDRKERGVLKGRGDDR